MIQTKPSDDIRDFLDFMMQTMGADAVRERVGALPDDIQRFAQWAKFRLPPLYLDYLREFGERDGALKMADDANSRVKSLIQFYVEQEGQSEPDIPPNGVVIGAFGLSGERALLYPELAEQGKYATDESVEPQVVVAWWGDVSHVYAQSFRNHLYRQAFIRGKYRDGALFSLYRNDDALLPKASEAVIGLGFRAYWFSDDFQACLEREDGSVVYIVRIPKRTSLYGRFPNEKLRDQLRSNLIKQLALTDSTPGT